MKSIEQYYNQARKNYIIRLSLLVILPITAVSFLITYFFISSKDAGYILFAAFLFSVVISVIIIFLVMLLFFSKSKVMKTYMILYDMFPKVDKSLLLLLSLYLIQNKKIYSLEKAHFYNKKLKYMGKSFGIIYNKETDEEIVGEILQYAKNINI